jgi:phage/plasmid-like protein (TIGR03299 family)
VRAGGLDWSVGLSRLRYRTGKSWLESKDTDSFAVVRSDTKRCLGVVGSRFTPLQNLDAFGLIDDLLEEGEVQLDAAGSLRGGKVVFVVAKVPGQTAVLGHEGVDMYVVLQHGHDGRHAVHLDVVPVLSVCTNTLAKGRMAAGHQRAQDNPLHASFSHLPSGIERARQAQDVLGLLSRSARLVRDTAETLAKNKLTLEAAERLLSGVYSGLPGTALAEQVRGTIETLEASPHISDEHRRDGWGVLNAVTEWQDWLRPTRTPEARLHRCWEGQGRVYRERATAALTRG